MRNIIKDLEGLQYGCYTIIAELEPRRVARGTRRRVRARCRCGAVTEMDLQHVQRNAQRCNSCPTKSEAVLIGDVFGFRTVVSNPYRKGSKCCVNVKCKCGDIYSVPTLELIAGRRSACRKCNRESHWPDDEYRKFRPFSRHPLYGIWNGIKDRVFNIGSHAYQNYGAKGIEMHKEWESNFGAFALWVENNLGPRPGDEWSIDRIDTTYGYHPTKPDGSYQLRWALPGTQNSNRRPFKKNWGEWQVGSHRGSLFFVCRKWNVHDTNVKNYIRPTTRRNAMTLEDALAYAIEKKTGATPEIKCIKPPEL